MNWFSKQKERVENVVGFGRDDRSSEFDDSVAPDRVVQHHEQRSSQAKELDDEYNATVAPSAQAWIDDPGRYDYPGVDTKGAEETVEEFFDEGFDGEFAGDDVDVGSRDFFEF